MKLPPALHRWPTSPRRAVALQRDLADRIRFEPLRTVRWVAGADAAYSLDATRSIAGIVVYDLETREPVEQVIASRPVRFPYVPGLLSFREVPAVLAAARKLRQIPDAFMFDAQGYAHPRRFGLACHAGLLLGIPSMGCAKSRLCGRHPEPATTAGAVAPLTDRGEIIGTVLRTRTQVKPVFVSAGHLVTLPDAVRIVLDCVGRYRLPEPTRLAHQLVTQARRHSA